MDAPDTELSAVTALIVNYQTLDLTSRCVSSLLHFYPTLRVLLVDNGSQDSSALYIARLAERMDNVFCVLNKENRYHGPAMDQGIRAAPPGTRYILTLDSDCEVVRGGFLQEMLDAFCGQGLYAIGRLVHMDRYGFEVEPGTSRRLFQYIHPHAMLLHRDRYLDLAPMVHHGSPCIENMQDAARAGYRLEHMPVERYIHHYGQGTCSRYGYGLGPRTLVERGISLTALFAEAQWLRLLRQLGRARGLWRREKWPRAGTGGLDVSA